MRGRYCGTDQPLKPSSVRLRDHAGAPGGTDTDGLDARDRQVTPSVSVSRLHRDRRRAPPLSL